MPSATALPTESQVDVLVIGAGPSGLMAAQALGELGVGVRVIERRYDFISSYSKINVRGVNNGNDDRTPGMLYGNADGIQPRTLEIWKGYGMLDSLLSKGVCVNGMVSTSTFTQVRPNPSSEES